MLGAVVLVLAVVERGCHAGCRGASAWPCLLVALSELLRLPFWHRGERLSIGWGEAAVLASCSLVHAPWLVIASFAGQVVAQSSRASR